MLEYLRNAADKPVAKILIGILAFSFVGWGVAEWIFSNVAGDTTLVRVGDSEVTMQQFSLEKNRQLAAMSREQQRATYADPILTQKLNEDVMSTLTTQAMTDNRAADLGFVVSDAQIAREIREFPEFQLDGQFSTYMFDNVLANSGYSEASFANILRHQVLRGYVLGAMSIPVAVPDFVAQAVYDARYSQRQIDYVTVNYSDFDVADPTDEQLRIYYEQNPHVIPEQRTVSYVLIPADMEKPDSYDEAYDLAIRVEDDIISGETLLSTSKKNNVKYESLGTFDEESIPGSDILTPQIISKIFGMEEGLESEIIETAKGFLILRVDKIIPSHKADFASIKSELTQDWKKEEQKKQAYIVANEKLTDLNKTGNLKNKKTAKVSRISGAPVEVLSKTFNSDIQTNTIVSGADAFYVLHIEKEIPAKQDAKKQTELSKELEKLLVEGIKDDYNNFLIQEYPVKVNKRI